MRYLLAALLLCCFLAQQSEAKKSLVDKLKQQNPPLLQEWESNYLAQHDVSAKRPYNVSGHVWVKISDQSNPRVRLDLIKKGVHWEHLYICTPPSFEIYEVDLDGENCDNWADEEDCTLQVDIWSFAWLIEASYTGKRKINGTACDFYEYAEQQNELSVKACISGEFVVWLGIYDYEDEELETEFWFNRFTIVMQDDSVFLPPHYCEEDSSSYLHWKKHKRAL